MLDYAALAALAEVARAGAFDAAARALGVTPSAVSQRVRELEQRMGATLVARGRPCALTALGARLVRHAEEVALLERRLAADLPAPGAPARLTLAVNADSLATWLPEALAQVEGMLFDLRVDDQDDTAERLRAGDVSGAIASDAAPIQGCDCLGLGRLRYVAAASPEFVARWFPQGPTRAALAEAPMLVYDRKDRLQLRWAQAELGQEPPRAPAHFVPSTHGFLGAARAGLGWGLQPLALAAPDIAAGRLTALSARPLDVPLYWRAPRRLRPALADLRRALATTARARLEPLRAELEPLRAETAPARA